MEFPQTEAAMASFAPLFEVFQTRGARPDRTAPMAERAAWHCKHRDSQTARAAVELAYANELLPAILGGTWKQTDSYIRGRNGLDAICDLYHTQLFDHALHYRRVGAKGMATWRNTVIVGRPYACFEHAVPDAVKKAEHLAETYHAGVWARRDLSAWYPGSTALVIAARGLRSEDAARFGFVSLAGE